MLNIRACRKALWTGLQPGLMSKCVLYVVPRSAGRGCRAEASRWPGGQSGKPLYNQPMKVGELLNLRTFTACALILYVVVTTFFRIIVQKNLFCLDHTLCCPSTIVPQSMLWQILVTLLKLFWEWKRRVMSRSQAGIPVRWPTWGITLKGQIHRVCPENSDQRSQICHQPRS